MPHSQFVVTPQRKSEIEQLSIQREVLSLLEKKVLQEVPQQEETRGFYSPLLLRTKPDGTFRVIINLKQLNKYLVIEKFKMETIKSCVRSLIPSCFMTVIDLKDAYYHVPIHPEFRKYLRVAVMIQGRLKHYQYRALPFGLAIAPRVFTKLMAEVMAHIREQNILIVPYLDDLLVMGSSSLHCSQQLDRVMVALSNLGWFLNLEKSRLIPSQVQLYLGIVIDSTKQECRLPEEKVSNMIHLVNQLSGSRRRNPPERCPRPLYPQDCPEENHNIPEDHQGEDLVDIQVEVIHGAQEAIAIWADQQGRDRRRSDDKGDQPCVSDGKEEIPGDVSTGGSRRRNPPERCPRPLYSQDCPEENHNIPEDHQGEDLVDIQVEVIHGAQEAIAIWADQQDGFMTRNPPERCPRPLCPQDCPEENHNIPEDHQEEDPTKNKAKEETEEEAMTRGDQPCVSDRKEEIPGGVSTGV
ncbi:unnamed protein product [Ranitomeya imitator]|uniref:ribonuclease H n=1 Tax=Ranitomeya imitator TaxID=111125 RepID=A0ABN9MEJ2_9NEOB|nr:unnamed protein product [Ranitomeya imitator]